MSAHTLGPWAVWKMGRTLAITCTGNAKQRHRQEGMHVISLKMPDLNEEHDALYMANAQLIATAPDGLALAELIESLWSSPLQSDYIAPAVRQAARALIAKATGVQP